MKTRIVAIAALCALIGSLTSAVAFAQERALGLNVEYGADTVWSQALQAAIDRAIDPTDYVCNAPTAFHLWANEQVQAIDLLTLQLFSYFAVPAWPADFKILFDNDNDDEYIGTYGQLTREQVKRHKDNQRFWDVPNDDILLMGMHGADIADDAKMLPLVNIYFALQPSPPPFSVQYVVDLVQTLIEGGTINMLPLGGPPAVEVPGVPGRYNHPLFTLNAFAFTDRGLGALLGVGPIPDKIVMGEGLIDALYAIGLGRNGPDYVHAHEFGHHVQFELPGAILPPPPLEDRPEATRRTEMMADAFAAYYSSHARGATFQAKNFADVMTAAFVVGDCGFASPGHHGTPDQRDAAAAWGGSITATQQKKGHILSPAILLEKFDTDFPSLVAPDAP